MPREQLADADALSKFNDRYDFSLSEGAMHIVLIRLEEAGLGSWDVDRFAAAHNAKAPRFHSLFATEGAEAVDAFSQSWSEGVSFVLRNFNRLAAFLIILSAMTPRPWSSCPSGQAAPFWRRIESGAWRRRVALDFCLEPGSIEANLENVEHCFFGNGLFNSRLRVMRTKKLGGPPGIRVVAADSSAPALPGAAQKRPRSATNRHERRKRARERATVPPLEPTSI